MKKTLTVAEFEYLVARLSNSCFVRHWIKWAAPGCEGYELALCCIDWQGQPLHPYAGDLAEFDYLAHAQDGHTFYCFRRAA